MQVNKVVQAALTRAGGKTLGGKPKYKFAWSADFTYLISDGTRYKPFRVVSEDCFLLLKFEPPEFWGTEEEWEANNYESSTDGQEIGGVFVLGAPLLTAGPYPRQGRYRNIMRIKERVTLSDGNVYLAHCAPTLHWVESYFPGIRDFQDLPVEQKAALLEKRENDAKEALAKSFEKSRENYRGAATVKQVKKKEEAIERWLRDKNAVASAQHMLATGKVQ